MWGWGRDRRFVVFWVIDGREGGFRVDGFLGWERIG